ncbi:MAG: PIN domain-containing protein [Candidatus Dormiibacterota bacterium]
MNDRLVLETSALLDLVVGDAEGRAVREVLRNHQVHIVDHVAVAAARALQRLSEGGFLSTAELNLRVRLLATAPFTTHPASALLPAAARRTGLGIGDALSMELSDRLAAPLLTTDSRLASTWPRSWLVASPKPA